MTDTRIAFGAFCTWWGPIQEVAKGEEMGRKIPGCPHCGGLLYEDPDRAAWDRRLAAVPADQYPDYAAVMEWQHETGRHCEKSYSSLREAYDLRKAL